MNSQKFNPQIVEYWIKIFEVAGKSPLCERELVDAMLVYHNRPGTPVNNTKCLGKIFKDKYRGYLLFYIDKERKYSINPQCMRKGGGI